MSESAKHSLTVQAVLDGLAEIIGGGRSERIRYVAANHTERWTAPEEKVRAEFWAELIRKYEYPSERIRFEVNVPRRTPKRLRGSRNLHRR